MESSREREIAQGLRHPDGRLTFPLDVLEYSKGLEDFEDGTAPTRVTSASYDLGRDLGRRRAEDAERASALLTALEAEQARRHQAVRDMLKDRPDVLAKYDADMARITVRRRA